MYVVNIELFHINWGQGLFRGYMVEKSRVLKTLLTRCLLFFKGGEWSGHWNLGTRRG